MALSDLKKRALSSKKAYKKLLRKKKKKLTIKELKGLKKINKFKNIKKPKEVKEIPAVQAEKLDPLLIPKYVNKLEKPLTFYPHTVEEKVKKNGKYRTQIQHHYRIDICMTMQQILPPGFPKTKVYGYGGFVFDKETGKLIYHVSSFGSTFEAKRGIPVVIKWRNRIKEPHFLAVDPTLHWANPNGMPMKPEKPWPPFPR